jgi:hypothetical protein
MSLQPSLESRLILGSFFPLKCLEMAEAHDLSSS